MHVPRRRFSQNFLVDEAVVARIVEAINPSEDERIVEIGPGKGALTIPLLARVRRLDAVEIDRDLAAALAAKCNAGNRLNLVRADALELDFTLFAAARLRVVGNLPYRVSTPLLFHLLRFEQVSDMVFTLQEEVVDRISAPAGAPEYGRLSVMAQARCEALKLFSIAPDAFRPRPAVNSALVRLRTRPWAGERIGDYARFAELVRTAFSARRKRVSNGLKAWFSAQQLQALGVSPAARPAELSVGDYVRLANACPRPGAPVAAG